MNRWLHQILAAAGALLALGAAPLAQAQPTWNFDITGLDPQCTANTDPLIVGELKCPARIGSSELAIKALSTTKDMNDPTKPDKFSTTAKVVATGDKGLGVQADKEVPADSQSSSVDNITNTDLLLMGFKASVVLNSITVTQIAKNGGGFFDTDVSILAWTGGTGVNSLDKARDAVKDKTPAQLVSTGWTLVGSFEAGTTPGTKFNAGNLASSYWLVSAYNSSYGQPNSVVDTLADVFRVFQVSGKYAPEPGTLVLAAAALAGLFAFRRRRSAGVPAAAFA